MAYQTMQFTADPYTDFLRHDAAEDRYLRMLPICIGCGQRIDEEYFWNINGATYHEGCAAEVYRESLDDYMED